MGLVLFGHGILGLFLASAKPFWYDELLTVSLGRFSSWSELWGWQNSCGDFNPFLPYLFAHVFGLLPGNEQVWIRLPFLISYLVFLLGVFVYAKNRMGASAAFLAVALACIQFRYAVEARGYAPVLAGGVWALWFWSRAASPQRQLSDLVGYTFALAFAMSANFYAVFLLFPFGVGELVRLWRVRRPDLVLWALTALTTLPVLNSLPVLAYARGFSDNYHDPVTTFSIYHGYAFLAPPPWATLLIVGIAGYWAYRARRGQSGPPAQALPPHEKAVIGAFAALPLMGFLVGLGVTGIFTARHYLSALLGIALAGTAAFTKLARGRSRETIAVSISVLLVLLAVHFQDLSRHLHARKEGREMVRTLKKLEGSDPIITRSPALYLQILHYAPSLGDRLMFAPGPAPHPTSFRTVMDWCATMGHAMLAPGAPLPSNEKRTYHYMESEGFGRGWRLTRIPE